MTSAEPFGGALWLRPGRARPHNLRSTRPDWVGRVTRGLPASRLPATLGSLFSLCSHAHVTCAGLAIDAALGRAAPVTAAVREQHASQTLREHLRRIWLDWPRQLDAVSPTDATLEAAGRQLARCPLFASAAQATDAAPWLLANAIGMPLAAWLDAWERDPSLALASWCGQAVGALPQRLRECRRVAHQDLPAVQPLRVHAEPETMRAWAALLRTEAAAFTRQPLWRGACAETGVWTRSNEAEPERLNTPWLRFGARLAEAVRLALPDAPGRRGTHWLQMGALPLGPGEAVAWVEMARGLLVHHVQIEGQGDAAHVAACHVVAPTEWNFHPDGAVARVLEGMREPLGDAGRRQLAALMAAYDPCVPFHQEQPVPNEVAHA